MKWLFNLIKEKKSSWKLIMKTQYSSNPHLCSMQIAMQEKQQQNLKKIQEIAAHILIYSFLTGWAVILVTAIL